MGRSVKRGFSSSGRHSHEAVPTEYTFDSLCYAYSERNLRQDVRCHDFPALHHELAGVVVNVADDTLHALSQLALEDRQQDVGERIAGQAEKRRNLWCRALLLIPRHGIDQRLHFLLHGVELALVRRLGLV